MIQIQIDAVPNQEFMTNVNGQQCRIFIRTLGTSTYFTLQVNGIGYVCQSIKCQDRSRLVRASYLGFKGDFMFVDLDAEEAPQYTGFNTRWILVYVDE